MKLIDIHTHGIGGYDTRTSRVQDILRMAEIYASAGVSEILPAIYPDDIQIMRDNMMAVRGVMEMQKSSPPHPSPKSATILGIHIEGPFLNPQRCGALNAAAFIEPGEYNLKKLLDGFEDIVKIITIAPEINGAARLIKKMADMGIIASMGHSDATYGEAEAGFHAGAKGITHIFNAMRGFHHREPGIAGFGLLNRDIYIEVIGDPYHLHSETLNLIFKTKNPERIIIVSDSVRETRGEDVGRQGVTDRSGRLQGGAMTVAASSKRLINLGFDEGMITKCISENPESYLSS